jgi:hypothetical protein
MAGEGKRACHAVVGGGGIWGGGEYEGGFQENEKREDG